MELLPVLIGGLITLAATSFVQVVIIPRVQRYNRRIERWEDNVSELVNVLEAELPRALKNLLLAGLRPHWYRRAWAALEVEGRDANPLPAEAGIADEAARAAFETASDLVDRARLLEQRIRPVNRDAFAHTRFMIDLELLAAVLDSADTRYFDAYARETADAYQAALDNVEDARKEALDRIKVFSDPMKPPRRRPVRRALQKLTRRLKPKDPKVPVRSMLDLTLAAQKAQSVEHPPPGP